MQKMKNIYLLFLLLAISSQLRSQQMLQFNQKLFNMYLLNSAYAGLDGKFHLDAGYRKQFTGLQLPFESYYFSAHSKLGERPPKVYNQYSLRISQPNKYDAFGKPKARKISHALGGLIRSDKYGPFSRFNGGLSYTLHYKLNDNISLAPAVSLGIVSYSFNDDGQVLNNPQDETYLDFVAQNRQASYMNVNTGLLIYSAKWKLSYAAHQVIGNQIWFRNNEDLAKTKVHHFINASYLLSLKEGAFLLEPGMALSYVNGLKPLTEFNALLKIKKDYFVGGGYRLSNSAFALLGMTYKNYRFSYVFEINTNSIMNYSSGSHELLLGLEF